MEDGREIEGGGGGEGREMGLPFMRSDLLVLVYIYFTSELNYNG